MQCTATGRSHIEAAPPPAHLAAGQARPGQDRQSSTCRSLPWHLPLGAAATGGEVREASGQAEAAQLDAPVLVQQHVGRLQVAVDHALRVQELRGGSGAVSAWSTMASCCALSVRVHCDCLDPELDVHAAA